MSAITWRLPDEGRWPGRQTRRAADRGGPRPDNKVTRKKCLARTDRNMIPAAIDRASEIGQKDCLPHPLPLRCRENGESSGGCRMLNLLRLIRTTIVAANLGLLEGRCRALVAMPSHLVRV